MTIAVGVRVIDESYAHLSPTGIVTAGASAVIRYTAGAATAVSNPSHALNAGKIISPTEFQQHLAAGDDVIANDEWYAHRLTEGAGAARQDAAAAMARWRECGLAKTASIYCSWDEAPIPSLWSAVDAYLEEYQQVLGDYYFVDAYAGTPYLKHALGKGLIRYGWRPNAGSWSSDGLPYQPNTQTPTARAALIQRAVLATPAAIWQTGNYWFGQGADENLIVRPHVGSHRQALASVPTPTPAPYDPGLPWLLATRDHHDAFAALDGGGLAHYRDKKFFAWVYRPKS